MKISTLTKLKLKLFRNCLLSALAAMALISLLLALNNEYHFSEKWIIHFRGKVIGHDIEYPSFTKTLLLSLFIYIIISVSTIVLFQSYCKYQYEKEKSQDKITPRKKFSKLALALMLFYFPFDEVIGLASDELANAFKASLTGVSIQELYLWIVYIVVLGSMIVGNLIKIGKIKVADKARFRKKSTLSRSILSTIYSAIFPITKSDLLKILKTLLLLAILSLAIILVSFGVSKIPRLPSKLEKWAPMIGGQKIEFLSNENNMLLMIFAQMMLFMIFYNFIIPAFKQEDGKKKSFLDCIKKLGSSIISKDFVYSTLRTICMTVIVVISICAVNTLYIADLSNVSSLIPLVLLVATWFIFGLLFAKQYGKKEEEQSIYKSNYISLNVQDRQEFFLSSV